MFLGCTTCFERYIHSSSGASKLYLQPLVLCTWVVAYRFHGRVSTLPWNRPATTHFCNTRGCTYSLDAPDDERKYHWKHVEQPRNNKLSYTVAYCWSFSYIIQICNYFAQKFYVFLKCLLRLSTSHVTNFKSKLSDGRRMDTKTFRTKWTIIPVRWTSQHRIWQGTGMEIAPDHAR